MAASTVSVAHLHTLNDPVVMVTDEHYNNTTNENDDEDDSKSGSSSVDTNEAFLDMLGLSSLTKDDDDAAAFPNSTTRDEEVVIVQKEDVVVVCSSSIRIPLPRRCSRYYRKPNNNHHCVALFADAFLSPNSECQALIQLGERHGFRYITEATHTAPDGSCSLRVTLANPNPHKLAVFENPTIRTKLWNATQRLFLLLDNTAFQAFCRRHGPPLGLNPRLRILRYDATDDDRFEPHFDATTVVGDNQQSLLTVLLYLNDGDGIDFEGGDTLFLDQQQQHPSLFDDTKHTSVTPKTGRVVIFEHGLFHASSPLVWGTKYILRTDILFARNDDHDDDYDDDYELSVATATTTPTTATVSDLCHHHQLLVNSTTLSQTDQEILQSMDLFDSTVESFLAPGISLLEAMLLDCGMDAATTSALIQAAVSQLQQQQHY